MADALLGATVGDRYRLTEEIGTGGMANVYRGEHLLLHRAVAVKVLLPELSVDENMTARFEREAIAAARLEHPNLVSITDFGRTPDGRMFLVMEFLEGTPLSDIIADELTLGWERAVEIARQVLRGLAHAHNMGVVHRDLKPSNVMIVPHAGGRETAKIIDFGIAKIVGGTNVGPHVETEVGLVFGTADFLAPERLVGQGDSDPRSDIYSVGVILYEALTGERPFHNDDPYVTVQRALAEPPKPPSQRAAKVPPALDAVVLRALEKTPEKRFQTAREMLVALDPLAKRAPSQSMSRPFPAPPVAFDSTLSANGEASPLPLYQPPPPRRRRALYLIPIGAALVILLIALGARSPGNPMVTPAIEAASPPPADADAEIAAAVKQAGEGATVEERQRAFDRLVALGYSDRVPWVAMLGRDLAQLPSCEARREVVAKLRKINDPKALPDLQKAAARPDNACLAAEARAATAALGGQSPAPAQGPPPTAVPAQKTKRSSGSGGGHF